MLWVLHSPCHSVGQPAVPEPLPGPRAVKMALGVDSTGGTQAAPGPAGKTAAWDQRQQGVWLPTPSWRLSKVTSSSSCSGFGAVGGTHLACV